MSWIFKDEPSTPPDPKTVRQRAMLFSLPFATVAILALIFLLHDEIVSGFKMERQKAMGLLSAAIVCGGLVALIFGITAKKQALAAGPRKTMDDEKPWLKREDWAAGRVASGTRKSVALLWFFTLFWNAVSAPIIFILLPEELHKGDQAVLLVMIFPVIGIGIFIFALNTTLAWRKFGQSFFELAAIPGGLGGTLEGEIEAGGTLRPEHGLHLRLSCIRQTTSGSGKDRHATEKILWQDEKWLRPDLPQTGANTTGIPVYFRLPADQPESTPESGDGIHWRLEASAKLRGPDFHAAFDVPVFKLAEPPESSDDPTARYQMSLDEIRQQIHSHVQVNDLNEGGKEFVFPAGRNPGFATGATVFLLIWTGVIVFLIWKQAPLLFPLMFGLFDMLMAVFAFDLWFRRSRVVAAAGQVQVEMAWLGVKTQHTLKVSEVADIATDIGATAGHTAYYDLKIRTRNGREITAAKNLGSKPEAAWLVQQMIKALKSTVATNSGM